MNDEPQPEKKANASTGLPWWGWFLLTVAGGVSTWLVVDQVRRVRARRAIRMLEAARFQREQGVDVWRNSAGEITSGQVGFFDLDLGP